MGDEDWYVLDPPPTDEELHAAFEALLVLVLAELHATAPWN
jgi:hypothetical protein